VILAGRFRRSPLADRSGATASNALGSYAPI